MKQKREIIVTGDIAIVPITKGLHAVIDAADVNLVEGYNWFAVGQEHTTYAVRRVSGVRGRGCKISMHRQILAAKESVEVDHIDLNGLNNRRSNIRECSRAENAANRRTSSKNTSGFKGVCWNKKSQKWQSQVKLRGVSKYLGLFETPEEAHSAYCEKVAELHGQFARTA